MSHAASEVFREGLEVFQRHDIDRARDLEAADDKVDLLYSEAMNLAVNPGNREKTGSPEWRVQAALTVHYLERIADHGVDIGERTVSSSPASAWRAPCSSTAIDNSTRTKTSRDEGHLAMLSRRIHLRVEGPHQIILIRHPTLHVVSEVGHAVFVCEVSAIVLVYVPDDLRERGEIFLRNYACSDLGDRLKLSVPNCWGGGRLPQSGMKFLRLCKDYDTELDEVFKALHQDYERLQEEVVCSESNYHLYCPTLNFVAKPEVGAKREVP